MSQIIDAPTQLTIKRKYQVQRFWYNSKADTRKPITQNPGSHILTYYKQKKIQISH